METALSGGLYKVSVLIPTPTVEKPRNIIIRSTPCPYPISRNDVRPRPNQLATAVVTQLLTGALPVGSMELGETSFLGRSTTGLNTVNVAKRAS